MTATITRIDYTAPSGSDAAPAQGSAEMLERFLAHPARPAGTLGYRAMRGFLFAITVAPARVEPFRWLAAVFGGKKAGFENRSEARAIVEALLGCHEQTVRALQQANRIVPDEVGLDASSDAALSEWATGFALGFAALRDEWAEALAALDEEEVLHFQRVFLDLTVWIDPRDRQVRRRLSDAQLRAVLADCRDLLPELLCWTASVGLDAYWRALSGRAGLWRCHVPKGREPHPSREQLRAWLTHLTRSTLGGAASAATIRLR